MESAVVVALVATVTVGVENPKPEAGVGIVVGTANSRMFPLEAPVDCATNAYAVLPCVPVRSLPKKPPAPHATEAKVVRELCVQSPEAFGAAGNEYCRIVPLLVEMRRLPSIGQIATPTGNALDGLEFVGNWLWRKATTGAAIAVPGLARNAAMLAAE